MRKLFVKYHTGYCGMDDYEVLEYPDEVTEEQIGQELYIQAVQHAQSYGIELCSEDCEDPDCEMEHEGSTNIEAYWEDYVPEKHDMYLR